MQNTKEFWDSRPCQLSSFAIQVRNVNIYVRNYVPTCGSIFWMRGHDLITAKACVLHMARVTLQCVWSNN